MKKSSILYWGMHVLILLIPFFFLSALRFKIATGDIVDLIAQEAAGQEVHKLPVIHTVEVSNSAVTTESMLGLKIILSDSLQQIKLDTTSAKYISYKVVGDKLIIVYDFKKDSIEENQHKQEGHHKESARYDYSDNERRVVRVYLQSNLTNITARRTNVYINLLNDEKRINDLDLFCYAGSISVTAPEIWEEEVTSRKKVLYNFEHRLGLHLFERSSATLENFGYIKQYDLELKGGSTMEEFFHTGAFNLTIDKKSVYRIDVNDLDQVKIKYE